MLQNIVIAILAILSVVVILISLMMEPKTQGAGTTYAQDGGAFGSTAHQAREKMLNKAMSFAGILAGVCLIALIIL